ncbi:MAG: ABC transporter permease subunit [Limnochordia bacterium]|jgi:sn-glycerol 3-phosphate transport system permease protein|nr:ABC transporter permease subunit [Limnochordia bacterium]MDI9465848.1 ABC transporter permease subunit [Bacillota bacterium]HAI51686.1 glycerol-3-phosphate transporter permease [Bacillota bacterium]HAN94320.1 glycerol-3-phosphate transporter permease [Bacillota bacterium]HOK32165.1 ABC transporter permease subunit [Limnochordia bacterium]
MERQVVFRNKWLPYLLLMPQIAITIVFFFWPALTSLRLALYRTTPFGDRMFFVGLQNFQRLFASPQYRQSVMTTLVFTASVTLVGVFISLVIALLLNQAIKGRTIYRTAILWPYGVALPVAGVLWMFLMHPTFGIVPYYLDGIINFNFDWILNGQAAMLLVILTAIWTNLGYNVAFFLAGLQAIPQSLLEAAYVDGATRVRSIIHITLPLLSPTIFFLLVMNVVYSLFDTFGLIDAVTKGGPAGATEIMIYKAYRDGIISLNLGSSAAQSVVLMVLAILLTVFQFRFIERKVSY